MRFLCRIGIHKWGKWSKHWYQLVRGYNFWADQAGDEYYIYRSLKCESCDKHKHSHVDTLIVINKSYYEAKPVWD